MSAAARRAQQAAQAKAAAEARKLEELGEAAGYNALRIKPTSSINPKQFWTAVEDYMRPLPKQRQPMPPPPPPPPERCPLTDRLLAALLPVPAALGAGAPAAADASSAAASDVEMADAPTTALSMSSLSVVYTGAQLELRLREGLVGVGLLPAELSERTAALLPDEYDDELCRIQKELAPLALANAQRLLKIHQRADAHASVDQHQRLLLSEVMREQRRQRKRLLQKEQQPKTTHAPKRKKVDPGAGGAPALPSATPTMPLA